MVFILGIVCLDILPLGNVLSEAVAFQLIIKFSILAQDDEQRTKVDLVAVLNYPVTQTRIGFDGPPDGLCPDAAEIGGFGNGNPEGVFYRLF